MEIPRLVHDEILHKLDEPRELELLNEVERLEHGAKILPDTDSVIVDAVSEKTPLIMAGKHALHVDPDFDLYALATKLTISEKATVFEDLHTPAKAILKEEFKHLIALMFPMMFVVLLETLPEMVLSMMMGHTDKTHSTQILAASSLSSLVQTMLVAGLINGLGSAIDTICSQTFGAHRYVGLWMFMQAGVVVYAVCFPVVAMILINGNGILRALGQDPVIARTASHLLLITLLSVPFLLLYSILKSALQAQNIVSPFLKTSSMSWAISLPIAYILGFWTPLSFYGIALSQVFDSAIKSMALLPLVMKTQVFQSSWPGWQWKNALRLVPKIARLAGSSILMTMFQLLGMSTIGLLAGLLPNADIMISANRMFSALFVLTFMPLLGVCVAGSIRLGNALGAGQARRAKLLARLVVLVCFTMSIVGTLLGLLSIHPFLRSFTGDPHAIQVASDLSIHLLPFVPVGGLLFGIQSIFRACGRQWLCAQLNFLFLFVFAIPLGLYLAIHLKLGIIGLWYGNVLGLIGFSLVGSVWWYHMSWETMAKEARENTHVHVDIDSECEEPEKSATIKY